MTLGLIVIMVIIVTMYARNSSKTRFIRRIGLTQDDYIWILGNKNKKSAAGFLEAIIQEYKKPNLFKRKK